MLTSEDLEEDAIASNVRELKALKEMRTWRE
jgi:hypothetical protein